VYTAETGYRYGRCEAIKKGEGYLQREGEFDGELEAGKLKMAGK